MPDVQVTERPRSLAPVRLPDDAPLDAARLSDVDEWGRSERYRRLARGLFGPVYRHWFRVEWEGLEHIPRTGAALLVANHAGAIPADAPVILHGVEEQLGRPGRGDAHPLQRLGAGAPAGCALRTAHRQHDGLRPHRPRGLLPRQVRS